MHLRVIHQRTKKQFILRYALVEVFLLMSYISTKLYISQFGQYRQIVGIIHLKGYTINLSKMIYLDYTFKGLYNQLIQDDNTCQLISSRKPFIFKMCIWLLSIFYLNIKAEIQGLEYERHTLERYTRLCNGSQMKSSFYLIT